MEYKHINDIVVPEGRQRKEFLLVEINELGESIFKVGLISAITINSQGELVAGERRLRAIRDLYEFGRLFSYAGEQVPEGYVPCVNVKDLTPVQAMEIELEENVRRKDLTWQERAAAMSRLAQCKEEIAKQEGRTLTKAELHEGLGKANGITKESIIRQSLLLAPHLGNPVVASAKNENEAFKALKRIEQTKRYTKLAEEAGAPSLQRHKHLLYNWDCLEWMRQADASQFDVVVTDPPYGMGADSFGDAGGKMQEGHRYADDEETLANLLVSVPDLLFKVMKSDSHLYLFCDFYRFNQWSVRLEGAGFRVFRTPLIWFKPSAYRAPWPEHGPQRKYECIIYAIKGNRKTLKLGGDVILCNPDKNIGHAAQKPVELFKELLSRSALPGDRVFDPFAGSGPLLPAAQACKCVATCVERDTESFGMLQARLEAL